MGVAVRCSRLVPNFGGEFYPIFGQAKDDYLATTVRTLFDENNYNQFYTRIILVRIP